jgi:hypothetical protein
MKPDELSEVVSDAQLERYRLDELPPQDQERVRGALAASAELRARLAALEESDVELLEEHPPAQMAPLIRARLQCGTAESEGAPAAHPAPQRPWLLRLAPLGAAFALAAILAVVAVRPILVGTRQVSDSGDRLKGLTPRLVLFRKAPGGPEALADGAFARPGDVIQVAYQAAGRRYGAIVSVDGRAAVTLHLPSGGGQAAKLSGGGPVLLDSAYQLDDAPRWEAFFFVVADAPFDSAAVVAAAHRALPAARAPSPPLRLDLPGNLSQSVFVLRKEAQR